MQQKLVQPENNNSSSTVVAGRSGEDINRGNDNNNFVTGRPASTTTKQLNKKQKEKNNNKQKPSNLKKQQKNEKVSKQSGNVKFAFEINENVHHEGDASEGSIHEKEPDNETTDEKTSATTPPSHQEHLQNNNKETTADNVVVITSPGRFDIDAIATDENVPLLLMPNNSNNNNCSSDDGNYDELPLIRIEEFGEDLADCDTTTVKPPHHQHTNFSKSSSESIPFIDESPRRQVSNYHDARFITITAQNVGATAISNQSEISRPEDVVELVVVDVELSPPSTHIERIHQTAVPKRDRFDKSAQILYQSQLEMPVVHHFEVVERLDVKLCQVCHEFLVVPTSVRCLTCGFVCHEDCVATKVSTFFCVTMIF